MAKAFMGYLLLSVLSIITLSSVSSAYTVSLTGACSLGPINAAHSYLLFRLNNSGDGPAQDIVISPIIGGAQPNQSTIFIPALNASTYNVSKISLQNLSANGTYIDSFVVTYKQGSDSFVTMFPCMSYINKYTQGMLLITNISQGNNKVTASIVNYGPYAIDANVSFLISPLYSPSNGTAVRNLLLQPGASSKISFEYKSISGTNNSFPAGIAAQYYHNGSHYAALQTMLLRSKGSVPFSFGTLIMLIVAVIVIIVALIIASLVVGRKKRKYGKAQQPEG